MSKAVHEAMEAERHLRAEREIIQLERDEKEREYEQAERLLHILDCAGRQQELDAQSVERIRYERQLEVLNQKEQDFDAERKSLGYTLRLHYEDEGRKQQEQLAQTVRQLAQIQEQLAAEEDRAESLRAVILEKSTLTGSVNARILTYDRKEETYNKRYEPGFLRNILGEYEPAALEIRLQEYEKELDGMKKTYLQMQKEAEEGSWKQKESERNLEDARQKKSRKHSELEHAQETCLRYQKELDERRKILRYFGLDESVLYDMDKILHAAENRLSEIELAKRKLEKEEDQLQKEYQHLTQGRILELPAEFEKLLAELGISYVYGMEWLKKNQYSEKENRRFVHAHPFLPYSLLLSQRDLDKLRQASKDVPYTSFPIPIMIRTQLEQAQDAKPQAVTDLQDVHFYMLFNEHLLNEKKLKQMAADLEQRLAQKKAQVQQRREEYGAYFEKKEQLRSQKVTREQEQLAVQKQEQLATELCGLSEEIGKQKEEMAQLAARLIKLQQQIQDNVRQQGRQERRLEDLRELEQAYQAYLLDKAQLNALQQELAAAREKEQLSRDTAGKLRERRKKQEIEQEHFLRQTEKLAQKAARYAQYEKTGRVTGDIRELENRYEAITSRISLRQQELERLLQEAGEKERRIGRELERRRKKYQLADGEWKQTAYDAKAEEYQEQLVHSKKQQYELKKAQWNEADKHAALASQRLGQQKNALMEKCRRQQPLPKHEIQPVDFEAEIEKHNYQWRELEKEGQLEQKRIRQYEETMTALAEYAEFMPENEKQLWEFLRLDLDIPAMQRNIEAAGQPEDTDADGNIHADIKKENPDISAEITPAGSGSDDVVIQENDKPYLALGANLKEDQKLTVLSLMGIDPANLSQYNVVTVTNEEEHQYLDDYLDASTIGTRALSSVVIVKREKGDGIHIATKNITYCTVGMYKNALATAGLEDADVIVAGPFPLSGTAALIGAMKAYADMENADVDTESLDAAMNEIVVTGELNESLGEDVQTEEFIAYVKQKVVEGGLQDKAKIQEVISKACSKFEIVLDDSEKEQITALMEKIGSLDIDVDSLLQQAGSIYDSLKEMEENTGFFGSIAAFFKNLLAAIIEFFQGLFGS